MIRLLVHMMALLLLLESGEADAALFGKKAKRISYEKEIKPLLVKYCYDCHGNGKKKGGLSLDKFTDLASIAQDRKSWEHILKNVKGGEMPPDDEEQPTQSERDQIIAWIDTEVFQADCDNPDPGRVTIRRLNRAEYNNTIRDLVGVEFNPADDFPVDDVGYGFDNIGDVLSLPPVLLEKYYAAAEKILDEAIVTTGQPLKGPKQRIEAETLKTTADGSFPYSGKAFALNKEGEIYHTIKIEKGGEYFLVARAFGQQAGKEPPKLEFRVDSNKVGVVEVRATEPHPKEYSVKLHLEPGEKRLAAAYINNFVNRSEDRNLIIDYLEVVGPLSVEPYPETHRRIFELPQPMKSETAQAEAILERFAKRAFRRPVQPEEVKRLMHLYEVAREEKVSFEEGIKVALSAILISPHFLFRGELQPEPDNPASVHLINEHALASRLSYFLWSTMPDEELTRLADRKQLRKNLERQVQRMLKDPRSRRLVDNFASQWLQIRNLMNIAPDKETFPGFDDSLREAMRKETELYFDYVMRENRSVLEFLDSDYTFVNERLAKHYGIKEVHGEEFRKVTFQKRERGGLLTQASILTITSNPTRTSPVKRGKWVLENVLGSPPPPPPPDVPELSEEKETVLSGSLRQRMEQHREKTLCSSCHSRMDPIGFGFENFDGIGAWREQDGKFPIEPGGQLVSGESFQSAAELKQILVSKKREEFLRCLTEKMVTYALGRGIEYYDKCATEEVLGRLAKKEYRFSELVLAIVESTPFQKRRGEGERLAAK
ncbi:MAG: DUF1592 domain-containing protein [Verrucomicrobiota bacterium]|nr:DUF1592 domain-containing protein [Verrucomicrobiota bacterium]